jgi:hypothetical protein
MLVMYCYTDVFWYSVAELRTCEGGVFLEFRAAPEEAAAPRDSVVTDPSRDDVEDRSVCNESFEMDVLAGAVVPFGSRFWVIMIPFLVMYL